MKEKITPAALSAAMNGDVENFLIAATPGGIEAQEARGQQEFVASETLPIECPRKDLESLGFVFGENADDLFVYVQFPEGWSKKPTDHSMWSKLVDSQGRGRGDIFYKAAFYDRSAHMRLNRRFSYLRNYELDEDKIQCQVFDCDAVVFETEIEQGEHGSKEFWNTCDQHEAKAEKWLKDNYPDYNNPMAYWD